MAADRKVMGGEGAGATRRHQAVIIIVRVIA